MRAGQVHPHLGRWKRVVILPPGLEGKTRGQNAKKETCRVRSIESKGSKNITSMRAEQPCRHQHERVLIRDAAPAMYDTYSMVQPTSPPRTELNPPTVGTQKKQAAPTRLKIREKKSKRRACSWYYTEPSRRRASTASRSWASEGPGNAE